MSRSGTYAFRDGKLVRVAARIPSLRPVQSEARDDASVGDRILQGYRAIEAQGTLTRKGTQPTTRQIRHALNA